MPVRIWSTLRPSVVRASALLNDERGSTLPLFAAAIIPTIALMGVAVDSGRAYVIQQKMQAALDVATLSAAREGNTNALRTAALKKYFTANFPDNYLGATATVAIKSDNRNTNSTSTSIDMTTTASAELPTTFISVLGSSFSTVTISAQTRIATAETIDHNKALEIAMAIDNTGSMDTRDVGNGQTRMQAVQDAASTFVNIVYSGTYSPDNIAIGISPFSTVTNVGRLLKANLVNSVPDYTTRPVTDVYGWKGCVSEDGWWSGRPRTKILSNNASVLESDAYDMNLENPATNAAAPKWDPFLFPPVAWTGSPGSNYYRLPATVNLATDNTSVWYKQIIRGYAARAATNTNPAAWNYLKLYANGNFIDTTGNGLYELPYLWSSNRTKVRYNNNGWPTPSIYQNSTKSRASPNFHCPEETLLQKWGVSKQTVLDYITNKNYSENPGIGTATNVGFVWAWRMLKAKSLFNNLVDNPQNLPTRQVLILFTDGFNSADGSGNGFNNKADTTYTAYGTTDRKLVVNTTSASDIVTAMDLRLSKACAAAKTSGVEIYMVVLKADSSVYKNCASDAQHYFNTSSATQIAAAFQAIAYELVPLHIVE